MGGICKGSKQDDDLLQSLDNWIFALEFLTQKTQLNSTVSLIQLVTQQY